MKRLPREFTLFYSGSEGGCGAGSSPGNKA